MKKVAIVLLALFIATSAVMAQEGLYVGAEFSIEDFENVGDTIGIKPYIGYGVEVVENFEVSAELGIPMWFKPEFGMKLELELGMQYSLDIFYFGLYVPMMIFSTSKVEDPFDYVGLNFVIGVETEAGIGGEVVLYNTIASDADFFHELDITAFYQMEALYLGITFGLPLSEDGLKYEGLTITPEVAYDVNENLNLYLQLPIGGIGAEHGEIGLGLTLGIKYSF